MKPAWEYSQNTCELIAKDIVKEYPGDSMVFIMPLKDNGAYMNFGKYTGHFIVSHKSHNETYYIDYYSNTIMASREAVSDWYNMISDRKSEIYDLGYEIPPFQIIYNYP
jgi:hypothetical protein